MIGRSFFVYLGDHFYYALLARELTGMKSVLDVGCGARSPLGNVPKTFRSVGVDIFEESVAASQKKRIHDDYILSDVLRISEHVPKKSFDAVIALDLIEHLNKKDGVGLIASMEQIAKKKVIIMTPNGFYRQEPYENNPFQVHKSGWDVHDFVHRGYRVYGIRGFKFLRGEYATLRWRPWFLWGIIASVSQYVLKSFPSISYQLFAVKDV